MFKLKDKLQHPEKGICEVKTIFKRDESPVYMLKPIHSGKKLQRFEITPEKAVALGMHYPIQANDVGKIYHLLEKKPSDIRKDREKGYPQTKEKIASGDLFQMAEALRDLGALGGLDLMGQKQNFIKVCEKSLIQGLSSASGQSEREIRRSMKKKLHQARKMSKKNSLREQTKNRDN